MQGVIPQEYHVQRKCIGCQRGSEQLFAHDKLRPRVSVFPGLGFLNSSFFILHSSLSLVHTSLSCFLLDHPSNHPTKHTPKPLAVPPPTKGKKVIPAGVINLRYSRCCAEKIAPISSKCFPDLDAFLDCPSGGKNTPNVKTPQCFEIFCNVSPNRCIDR
jgi:hypothetical protein